MGFSAVYYRQKDGKTDEKEKEVYFLHCCGYVYIVCLSDKQGGTKYAKEKHSESAEKPYFIVVGDTERTINLYAVASMKFQIAV